MATPRGVDQQQQRTHLPEMIHDAHNKRNPFFQGGKYAEKALLAASLPEPEAVDAGEKLAVLPFSKPLYIR